MVIMLNGAADAGQMELAAEACVLLPDSIAIDAGDVALEAIVDKIAKERERGRLVFIIAVSCGEAGRLRELSSRCRDFCLTFFVGSASPEFSNNQGTESLGKFSGINPGDPVGGARQLVRLIEQELGC